MTKFSSIFAPISLFFLVISIFIYLIEAITYPGSVAANFGISPKFVLAPAIIFFAATKLFSDNFPSKKTEKIITVLALTSLVAAVVFTTLDVIFYQDFVLNIFKIYPASLTRIAMLLSLILMILKFEKLIPKIDSKYLFVLPFWLFILTALYKYYSPFTFAQLAKEDSVIEYATAGFYLLLSLLGVLGAKKLSSNPPKNRAVYFLQLTGHALVIIGSFLIAGEEISWGQRIIGIQTPEHLAAINTQEEINLHNNRAIFGYVYRAYFLLSFYASFSWIAADFIAKTKIPNTWKKLFDYWSPSKKLIGFFLPTLIFTIIRAEYGSILTDPWEETVELFLAIGLCLFLYLNQQKYLPNKASGKNTKN